MGKICLPALLALVLLTAACGPFESADQDDSDSETTTTTTSAPPDPTEDRRRAEAIVLTAADLPGWTESPGGVLDSEDVREMQKYLGECQTPKMSAESLHGNGKEVAGPSLDNGEALVESTVVFIADEQTAANDLAALGDTSSRECEDRMTERYIRDQMQTQGSTTTTAGVDVRFRSERMTIDGFTNSTVAYRSTLDVTMDGQPMGRLFTRDVIFTTFERAMITVVVTTEKGIPDRDLESRVLQKIRSKTVRFTRTLPA